MPLPGPRPRCAASSSWIMATRRVPATRGGSRRQAHAVHGGQLRHRVVHDRLRQLAEDDGRPRGLRADLAGELGTEHRDGVIGGEDDELAVFPLRVEARLAAEDPLEHVAGDLGPVEQYRAERGQLVPGALPDQQLVAEVAAQPGERGARRRLAEADPLPGTGHVALRKQRVQGDDEVHVKSGQVHATMISSP